ncbi:TMEM175 family protein [uncultured Ligilactobacillus sp.]|uniref:TMEM175 family protein n=1 Tax=uncultured Ligilactobacillus sp. TaxID=2837633 RepID=UPI00272B4673|nr:TMEM175 family protein [uncultured Ligilactobacillus sp.]
MWELRTSFFAYALSFFWIGGMWVNMHTGWHDIKKISPKVVWNTMFLLFFSSFFPYVTSLVSQNFYNEVAQVFYGVIILAVTTFNTLMYRSLAEIPENNKAMTFFMNERKWISYDIALKVLGLILSI